MSISIYRADLFAKIRVANYKLTDSSEILFEILKNSSALKNVNMTKVRKDKEEHGKITIEEWYEISGSFDVPEGGKSFWVISKDSTTKEPYNFFMRVDRNIEAQSYDIGQNKAVLWVKENLTNYIEKEFTIEDLNLAHPTDLSVIAKKKGDVK